MKELPVAGTFRLDGMLQASLGGDPMAASQVESWIASAAKQGLKFHLQLEGSGFSILGVSDVCKTSATGSDDLGELITDALQSLLDQLPEAARKGVMSTIRSEEFRPGAVIQTLYSVGPVGDVLSEERTLDIETEEPPPELTPASIRRYSLYALLALIVSLGISSLFIDYRKLFSEARDQVAPLSKEEVTLESKRLGDVVTVDLLAVDNRRKVIILEFSRGPGWEAAVNSKPNDDVSWPVFLMHQAVHDGQLSVELLNKEGELLRGGGAPLDKLHSLKTFELVVPARHKDRLTKVVVRP